ncbi:hypothetical protein LW586_26690 (plasmid) [Klebsiella quasipneumoniae]
MAREFNTTRQTILRV